MVKRWCENPVNGGSWVVLESDYDALAAERDALRAAARRACDALERHVGGYAPMRIPMQDTDSDRVLADLRALLGEKL